jgi:hypothetical protein
MSQKSAALAQGGAIIGRPHKLRNAQERSVVAAFLAAKVALLPRRSQRLREGREDICTMSEVAAGISNPRINFASFAKPSRSLR